MRRNDGDDIYCWRDDIYGDHIKHSERARLSHGSEEHSVSVVTDCRCNEQEGRLRGNRMIVNIPLQIDETKMEEVLQRDYEGKVLAMIDNYVKTTLTKRAEKYYGDKVDDGMRVLIEMRIDEFLKAHRDEVIEKAAAAMAEKLARSKRGKEILENVRT